MLMLDFLTINNEVEMQITIHYPKANKLIRNIFKRLSKNDQDKYRDEMLKITSQFEHPVSKGDVLLTYRANNTD